MAGKNVLEINNDNFQGEVLQSDVPVVVDFWAEWCGPCRMLGPIIEEVADDFAGKVKVCKLNVDENNALASEYRVASIPTVLFFKGGEVVDKMVGYSPKTNLTERIEKIV